MAVAVDEMNEINGRNRVPRVVRDGNAQGEWVGAGHASDCPLQRVMESVIEVWLGRPTLRDIDIRPEDDV